MEFVTHLLLHNPHWCSRSLHKILPRISLLLDLLLAWVGVRVCYLHQKMLSFIFAHRDNFSYIFIKLQRKDGKVSLQSLFDTESSLKFSFHLNVATGLKVDNSNQISFHEFDTSMLSLHKQTQTY